MRFVEGHSQTTECLTRTLMSTLTIMKFDSSRIMHEHVIEMTNIATRLTYLEMIMDKVFVVQFILNLLPFEYDHFQMNYNTMKYK